MHDYYKTTFVHGSIDDGGRDWLRRIGGTRAGGCEQSAEIGGRLSGRPKGRPELRRVREFHAP